MASKKKRRIDLLDYLKNHRFVKWLVFIAALIGAATTIYYSSVNIYKYLNSKNISMEAEYEKIRSLNIGAPFEYVEYIFGKPNKREDCIEYQNSSSYLNSNCKFSDSAARKYLFNKEDYYLRVLVNKDDIVIGYDIFLKNKSFNPELNLFIGRFFGEIQIILGKSKLSHLDEIENDGSLIDIEDITVGNNFGGYIRLIYNPEDYAAEYFIVVGTVGVPPYAGFSSDIDCDLSVLSRIEGIGSDLEPLNDTERQDKLSQFKSNCPIQGIGVFDNRLLYGDYSKLSDQEKDIYLRDQLGAYYHL